jgi:hypothetical protein
MSKIQRNGACNQLCSIWARLQQLRTWAFSEVGSLKWARRTHPVRFAMLRGSCNTDVGPRNLKGGQSIQIPDLLEYRAFYGVLCISFT